MKKLLYVAVLLFILTGCGNMNNTPTKKVEELLNKYQTNDIDVVSDLSDVLMGEYNMTDDERNDYASFMKKHYQDMVYKIKDETINGDNATVEAEITVRNYADVVNQANDYRSSNPDKFDEDNSFSSYRLKKMKDVSDTQTYTLTFNLTKDKDEWKVSPLSSDDESMLNGLYGVNDYSSDNSNITTDESITTDETNTTDEANITTDETE
ncbi:MAG: lipoprotein [Bacilli bacterium]|nr:lipoprotein [Bacilli bacterium]